MTVNTAKTTEDTSVDEVDTSTDDEAQETEAELESSDISFEDEDDSSEDDETEESEEPEEDESADESTEETEEESEEDVEKDEETEAEETTAEEKKAESARKAFEKREAARLAKEKTKREAEGKYLSKAKDDSERAFRQLQIDAYNNNVRYNSDRLENGIEKAVARIDIISTGTPAEQDFMKEAIDDFERMYVVRDKNGDPIEVKGDVYEYLAKKAESARKLTGVRASNAQEAKGKTKARTMAVPSRKPKEGKRDVDLDAFDEEADRW